MPESELEEPMNSYSETSVWRAWSPDASWNFVAKPSVFCCLTVSPESSMRIMPPGAKALRSDSRGTSLAVD
jgi:hypothetical protein